MLFKLHGNLKLIYLTKIYVNLDINSKIKKLYLFLVYPIKPQNQHPQ